ncbi:MAG: c-type cytochrome, partial [Gammaproteobacteria bacterium]
MLSSKGVVMYSSSKLSVAIAAIVISVFAVGATTAAANGGETSSDAAIRAAEAWAFPKSHSPDPSVPKQAHAPKPDMHKPMHVPGSTRTYTPAQLDTGFDAADWFPRDHPPMPHIVVYGRKSAWACADCHKPGGEGFPSTAELAGLPKAYLREQLQAFRDGQRDNDVMPKEARRLDDADEQSAIAYFSKLKPASHVRLVETASVPTTHWSDYVLAPDHDGAREPIGERIIEVQPEDGERGDERVVYTAYVPPGS